MNFDNDFFQKELRCNFEVPAMMKRVWAAELEVLDIIQNICENNGIQYYASGGTLLGAIRHKGFIPWDDDIDLEVKRDDYEKLIRILPEQLPDGFRIYGIHAPERRKEDTLNNIYQIYIGAERNFWNINEYIRYFHGFPFDMVGVDIFPLDYVPRDVDFRDAQVCLLNFVQSIFKERDELIRNGTYGAILSEFENASGIHISEEDSVFELWKAMDAISSLCQSEEADELIIYSFYNSISGKIKKEWYDDVIVVPFENTEICVPAGYDGVLKGRFGNYREFVKGKTLHNYPFYQEMEKSLSEQLAVVGLPSDVEVFVEKILCGEIVINENDLDEKENSGV